MFGMLKTVEKLYSYIKNYHSFQELPITVRNKLNISSKLFKKDNINAVASHHKNLSYKTFVSV